MTDTINVALVGYGLAGKVFHAPLILATPGLRLATIVSSDAAKVHADHPDVAVVGDLDRALADPAIDLVVIAAPDAVHVDIALAALDAGKHVMIDKPVAPTLAEAQRIAAHPASRSRVVSVFQSRRWDGDFLTLRRLIAEGALGEIVGFESHYDRFRPTVVDRWKEREGAGIWQDLGPHLVDQALTLFGWPEAIAADIAIQRDGGLAPDFFHVVLHYPRMRALLRGGLLVHDTRPRLSVHGLKASFVKQGMDRQEFQSREGMRPGAPGWGVDPLPGQLVRTLADGSVVTDAVPAETGDYPAFYAALRDAIAHGTPNPVPLVDALGVMAIIDHARHSAAEGRVLPLPPAPAA